MFGRRGKRTDDGDRIGNALREARAWLESSRESQRRTDIEQAVAAGTKALRLCGPEAPERFAALLVLSEARALRHAVTTSIEDLQTAVELHRELVDLSATEHPDMSGPVLRTFAFLSLRLGLLTGGQRHIEDAALTARELDELAERTDSPQFHAVAADLLAQATPLLPPDHPDRAALAALRASALLSWVRQSADPAPLDDALEEIERALRLCAPDDPNRAPFLVIHSEIRALLYHRDGSLEALNASIEAHRTALDHYSADHEVSTRVLHNLGRALCQRYELTEDAADLDNAAHSLRLALEHATDPQLRDLLEQALEEVAELRGPEPPLALPPGVKLKFLAAPGMHPRRPIAEIGDDIEEFARHTATLSMLLDQYERTREPELLERICADGRALLQVPAIGDERWLVGRTLGPALMRRFETTGDSADLDEAIELLHEIVVEEPVLRPSYLAGDLMNLAAALINRFLRDRDGADLDQAITHCRRSVELTDDDRPEFVHSLNTLGTALIYRFEHHGRRFDLDEAIELGKTALARSTTQPEIAHAHSNLGNRLLERFRLDRDPADLDTAVDHLRTALDSYDEPSYLLTLALCLHERGSHNGDRGDLQEALDHFRTLLGSLPERAPLRQTARLGSAQTLSSLGDTEQAMAVLTEFVRHDRGSSFERMDALVLLARLHAKRAVDGLDDWRSVARAFAGAQEQLQLTIWRGLRAPDRRRLLTRWPAIANDGAAAALSAGEPEWAVEMLDHGRFLWWGQVLDTRTDLSALQAAHPELADRLAALRAQAAEDMSAGQRRQLAADWDDVVATVRTRPGFERFLLPMSFTELKEAATDGPVVLVNVSRYRCDALVVTLDDVQVVPLPELTADDAARRTREYLTVVAGTGTGGLSAGAREQALMAYLEWLWDVVAEPVLTTMSVPAGARLWWCANGPLALSPLPAAGYHDPDDLPRGRTVLDRVVSSMTPTLRSLQYSRRRAVADPTGMLVVACERRPDYITGLPDLPSATREAALLRSRFPDTTTLEGEAATTTRTTEALAEHACAHFACHGGTTSTGEAALFLSDAPLTLIHLAQLDLDNAHLAVLSACRTAMGDADLPDEAHHIAAALQVAGFRHVVSALWDIGDDTATVVADHLYRELTTDEGTLDPSRTARALHAVIHELRRQNPYQPSRWAPFIHLGQ